MYRRGNDRGESGDCGRVVYGDHPDGSSISVWNMEWYGKKPNQTTNDIRGRAYCPDGKSGKCLVSFKESNSLIPEGNYNVIDVDYD